MKYAAKIKADKGWFYILGKSDGTVSFTEIDEWGIVLMPNWKAELIPLDNIYKTDVRDKKNFIAVLDPNEYVIINDELKSKLIKAWADIKNDPSRT